MQIIKGKILVFLALIFSAFLISAPAYSANQDATSACSDKDEGDPCSFVNDKGDNLDGTCKFTAGVQSALVCTPYQQ